MIRIITGGIGSGKSRRCLDEIEKIHIKHPSSKCLMIVNDHYSHETEKAFVERFGGTGLNNIEVTTFRKLSRELLSDALMHDMSPSGKRMLLQKTVAQYLDEEHNISGNLRRAIKQSGFLDVLASMLSEMKHYGVNCHDLYFSADSVVNNVSLNEKLSAFARMYELYTENFDALDYTDSEDNLEYLAQAVLHSGEFENVYMWIDKFDEILPQQMQVVEALHSKVKALTVSVCYPQNDRERTLYSETERTLRKIEALDSDIEYVDCGSHLKGIKSQQIKFLLDKWNTVQVYDKKTDDIKIYESRNAYGEVEHTAAEIIDLVRENGFRFRDIAVVSGSEEEYGHLIDTIFEEYEIPTFSDTKIVLSDHPIAMQIISVFDIFENNFDYSSVFEYLKAGFIYEKTEDGTVIPFDRNEIDELENFVLKHGIRQKSRWFSEWKNESSIRDITSDEESEKAAEQIERINKLRERIIAPFKRYEQRTKNKTTCDKHAKELFMLLEEIHLCEGLQREIAYLIEADMITEADRFEQIWTLILEVLDQLVITLGDTEMDRTEFESYVRTGISQCEIRIIPSGIDRVYVGTAERNAAADIKALFIVGANEGTFPSDIKAEGFLSNADRQYINNTGIITVAPDTRGQMEKRRYTVYKTLASAAEKLYISYSVQNIDGAQQRESRLVTDIIRRFPKIQVEDDVNADKNRIGIHIASPKVTIHKLLKNKNSSNPIWNAVYSYYAERDMYPHMIEMLDNEDSFVRRFETIPPEEAEELYGSGKIDYSASRINVYAKCPYRYFMQYGLGLKEREIWEISAGDIGTYVHSVIEGFCHAVESGETDPRKKSEKWRNLSEKSRDEILAELFNASESRVAESSITQRGKVLHVMQRMERVIKNAVMTVHSSLKNGKYTIAGEEQKISMDISEKVALRGLIDRLDICDGDGYKGIRVIDYKTGATVFNIVNILHGVDMQMVLYAAAAKEYYSQKDTQNKYRLTGIYYNHVRSDFVNQKTGDSIDKIKGQTERRRCFDGMTFLENENDMSVLADMDSRIGSGGQSDFLDIKLNKNGTINHYSKPLVKTFDQADALMEFVKETAVKYDNEIRCEGKIKPEPYCESKTFDPCTYCEYSQVCGIFPEVRRRVPKGTKTTADKLWDEKINNSGKESE